MAVGREDFTQVMITTSKYNAETKVSCTAVHSTVTLATGTKAIEVYNDGAGIVYMLLDGTATTNSRPIRSRVARSIDFTGSTVGLICDTGKTATVWITELK